MEQTTENPSFEVIPALRSRARVYILEELSADDLKLIIRRAVNEDEFLKSLPIKDIDENYLLYVSGGDSRILLNILEDAIKIFKFMNQKLISQKR